MLRISKLADYGTVIMSCLAKQPEHVFSAAEVAQQTHLANPTVSKVLKMLSDAGLVISTRGANGGYRIARVPADISIAQIITAIDGQPALTECARAANLCSQDTVCAVKSNWQIINQFVMNALTNLTLIDMNKPLHLLNHMQEMREKLIIRTAQDKEAPHEK